MTQAKNGDTVKVNYTGRLADGSVFDSTENREPLQFKLGDGRLIEGLEESVVGMQPGESKTVKLPPEQAYGPRRDEMVVTIDRAHIPQHVEPQVGQKLELAGESGRPIEAIVNEVSESSITVDANHPLAGCPLTFEIQLLEVA